MNLNQPPIYLTGASGFLGQTIQSYAASSFRIIPLGAQGLLDHIHSLSFESGATVVHLAARVHVMRETAADPLVEFRRSNRDLTLALAERALDQGVAKFVFISSLAVFGRFRGGFVGDTEPPCPTDPYGLSKWEAEQGLARLFQGQRRSRCIVLRLPMVYGPGNKGNMLPLLSAAAKRVPLPLGCTHGKRSMAFSGNVAHAILRVIQDEVPERPSFSTYFLNDGEDLTSGELYRLISKNYHGNLGVFPFPGAVLKAGGWLGTVLEKITHKRLALNSASVSQLLQEYRFSSEHFCHDYHWTPPFSPAEGIRQTVDWHKSAAHQKRTLSA
jgi:UDP-glucose 4-epimerase